MNITIEDIDTIEQWWVEKSRKNFFAYRQYIRCGVFEHNWFIADMCRHLQQFYLDLKAGKRPVLFISTPPQHGKSWAVTDFIAWISGLATSLRIIYASYSETLGIRCNTQLQRYFDSKKHKKIFPDLHINDSNIVTTSNKPRRNSSHIEYVDKDGIPTGGQFRNTTIRGPITGETLDVGVIDDAVKGREEANSPTISQKNWEWFTDDFYSRFTESGGLIIIMTRWTTHDIIARFTKKCEELKRKVKLINYKAVATATEKFRDVGEALFPKLKSLSFLEEKKALMPEPSWESLYQGSPTISGGDKFKDDWWGWWKKLPPLEYKFITADTAQKDKRKNDWTVFQCWGFNKTLGILLLDKFRAKLTAPNLRREAELFYKKHDTPREKVGDPILRGMYIEDKSSGTGLIQELRKKRMKIKEVPRNTDKNFRADDVSPIVEAGLVHLNVDIPGVSNLTSEGRIFPNGEFDDDIDTLMTAVEVAFINKDHTNMLQAAMEADY